MLVELRGDFDEIELEDAEEDSAFLEVAESEACSLMDLSCELSPESCGDADASIRWAEVNDRIRGYGRLGRECAGHGLEGGSLKALIIFAELRVSN